VGVEAVLEEQELFSYGRRQAIESRTGQTNNLRVAGYEHSCNSPYGKLELKIRLGEKQRQESLAAKSKEF
jgi:hypothetical protein